MKNSTGAQAARNPAVLDEAFVQGLDELPIEEVRRRRDEALAEREFQSYLRRVLQVRHDMLAAEQERRRSGGEPGHVVDRLTKVLSEGPRGGSRGEALRFNLSSRDMEEAGRRVEEILGDVGRVRPEDIGESDLTAALEQLTRGERAVSASRLAVFRVHDRLQDELKRRFREDPSQVRPLV